MAKEEYIVHQQRDGFGHEFMPRKDTGEEYRPGEIVPLKNPEEHYRSGLIGKINRSEDSTTDEV
jgi:hypothetical protein